MKIGEALNELKREKEELKRLIDLRQETFWIEKQEKAVVSTKELTTRIEDKMASIREKKINIQKKNLDTLFGEMSIAEVILRIADLRNEIKALGELKDRNTGWRLRDEKENKVAQLNPLQVDEFIERLEKEKTKLDSAIQSINWEETLRA